MTENTQSGGQFRTADENEKESIRAETTSDGRYIPYSGGIMTWFENSGLLKCEAPQMYRFHEMVDAAAVRLKLFERWGGGENISRRASDRHVLRRQINLELHTASGEKVVCSAKDYSSHGLRLQLPGVDHPRFSKGDKIRVVIQDEPVAERVLFDIASQVMWAMEVGKTEETLSVGIAFMDLSMEKRQALLQFLRR